MEVLTSDCKISLKHIFLDNGNWWKFFLKYRRIIRRAIVTNVLKMLACRTAALGYRLFRYIFCSFQQACFFHLQKVDFVPHVAKKPPTSGCKMPTSDCLKPVGSTSLSPCPMCFGTFSGAIDSSSIKSLPSPLTSSKHKPQSRTSFLGFTWPYIPLAETLRYSEKIKSLSSVQGCMVIAHFSKPAWR